MPPRFARQGKLNRYCVFSFVRLPPSRLDLVQKFTECPLSSVQEITTKLGQSEAFHNKRLKTLEHPVEYQFVDITFFSSYQPVNQVISCVTEKDCENLHMEQARLEKAIYEEIQVVDPKRDREAVTTPIEDLKVEDDAEQQREVIAEMENPKFSTGFVVIAFQGLEDSSHRPFVRNWKTWTGIRYICMQLPRVLGLRRISFYRRLTKTSPLVYVLVIEISNLLFYTAQTLNLLETLKLRLCGYLGVFRQIPFVFDPASDLFFIELKRNPKLSYLNPLRLPASENGTCELPSYAEANVDDDSDDDDSVSVQRRRGHKGRKQTTPKRAVKATVSDVVSHMQKLAAVSRKKTEVKQHVTINETLTTSRKTSAITPLTPQPQMPRDAPKRVSNASGDDQKMVKPSHLLLHATHERVKQSSIKVRAHQPSGGTRAATTHESSDIKPINGSGMKPPDYGTMTINAPAAPKEQKPPMYSDEMTEKKVNGSIPNGEANVTTLKETFIGDSVQCELLNCDLALPPGPKHPPALPQRPYKPPPGNQSSLNRHESERKQEKEMAKKDLERFRQQSFENNNLANANNNNTNNINLVAPVARISECNLSVYSSADSTLTHANPFAKSFATPDAANNFYALRNKQLEKVPNRENPMFASTSQVHPLQHSHMRVPIRESDIVSDAETGTLTPSPPPFDPRRPCTDMYKLDSLQFGFPSYFPPPTVVAMAPLKVMEPVGRRQAPEQEQRRKSGFIPPETKSRVQTFAKTDAEDSDFDTDGQLRLYPSLTGKAGPRIGRSRSIKYQGEHRLPSPFGQSESDLEFPLSRSKHGRRRNTYYFGEGARDSDHEHNEILIAEWQPRKRLDSFHLIDSVTGESRTVAAEELERELWVRGEGYGPRPRMRRSSHRPRRMLPKIPAQESTESQEKRAKILNELKQESMDLERKVSDYINHLENVNKYKPVIVVSPSKEESYIVTTPQPTVSIANSQKLDPATSVAMAPIMAFGAPPPSRRRQQEPADPPRNTGHIRKNYGTPSGSPQRTSTSRGDTPTQGYGSRGREKQRDFGNREVATVKRIDRTSSKDSSSSIAGSNATRSSRNPSESPPASLSRQRPQRISLNKNNPTQRAKYATGTTSDSSVSPPVIRQSGNRMSQNQQRRFK